MNLLQPLLWLYETIFQELVHSGGGMSLFEIDKRLELDSIHIKSLELSDVRLMKDPELDWFLLIPRRPNLVEMIDLNFEDQVQVLKEINFLSSMLLQYTAPKKINIASLGNMVSQLHWHVLARYESDRAWPAPIWGGQSNKIFNPERATYWKNIFIEAKS